MALKSGWEAWDSAKTWTDTPNGCDPQEERDHWLELARTALDAVLAPPKG